jgi:protein TonB
MNTKKSKLFCTIFFLGMIFFAQNAYSQTVENKDTIVDIQNVELKPEFPGGEIAMWNFLFEKISYPVNALADRIQGRVTCQFIIKKDGSVSNVEVINPIKKYCSLEEEAIRVINLMPKWEPAQQNGQPVSVKYKLPVVFKLDD